VVPIDDRPRHVVAPKRREGTYVYEKPGLTDPAELLDALRKWQEDAAPIQLHPGDVGFLWQLGNDRARASLHTWRVDGELVAVGLLLDPELLRLAIAPRVQQDAALAQRLADDFSATGPAALLSGTAELEVAPGAVVRDVLAERGWTPGEPWTLLQHDLSSVPEDVGLRVVVAGPEDAETRTAVHRSAFTGSGFTADRWHAMAAGPAYADARCVLLFDREDVAVAASTAWAAGPGRPGLLEPVAVHADHRGRGYGRAVTLAAVAVLRDLGSSSAVVTTESANTAAVATYRAAGFEVRAERLDVARLIEA
jgi:ribosomal protein S18 acetylase RimI-like enzyme